jgi:hypothetical protein
MSLPSRQGSVACASESGLLGTSFPCQLEAGHDGPHQHKDDQGTMTWEPRYVAELRRDLEEAVRLLANATDPENAGDWDEAREMGWAFAKGRVDE